MENNYFVLRYQWMCKHMSGNEFLSSNYFNLEEFAGKSEKKKLFILMSPIGGEIYYVDFHNTHYNIFKIPFFFVNLSILTGRQDLLSFELFD
jgi:hypothetical protein